MSFEELKRLIYIIESSDTESSNLINGIDVIPSKIPTLDSELQIGGIPLGCLTGIYGEPDSGKSVLSWYIIKSAQELGLIPILIDTERKLDPKYISSVGVDTDLLIITHVSKPSPLLSVCETGLAHGAKLIVVDTITSVGFEDFYLPDSIKCFCSALCSLAASYNASIVLLSQMRYWFLPFLPGWSSGFGTYGCAYSNILGPYTSIEICVEKGESIVKDGVTTGHIMRAEVAKNRCTNRVGEGAELDLIYGKGFDIFKDLVKLYIKQGYITQSGPYFIYKGNRYLGFNEISRYLKEEE